ncbi:hypothetical protein Droror1_Dr00014544 [Drosera rotundifolia]
MTSVICWASSIDQDSYHGNSIILMSIVAYSSLCDSRDRKSLERCYLWRGHAGGMFVFLKMQGDLVWFNLRVERSRILEACLDLKDQKDGQRIRLVDGYYLRGQPVAQVSMNPS